LRDGYGPGVLLPLLPVRDEEDSVGDRIATVRWTAASVLVGGLLYGLYGLLNPFFANILAWQLVSQLLGGAFLTVGVIGLRLYLREQNVPLGGMGRVGLWACIIGLAVWTVLGFAAGSSVALVGPTLLAGRAFHALDFFLLVVFLGSALLGTALYLQTNVVPRGASLALVIASVLALVPALADNVLPHIPIGVFEAVRVVYGAGWALVGYGLWTAREAVAPRQARVR
jgi:hypothetical protein